MESLLVDLVELVEATGEHLAQCKVQRESTVTSSHTQAPRLKIRAHEIDHLGSGDRFVHRQKDIKDLMAAAFGNWELRQGTVPKSSAPRRLDSCSNGGTFDIYYVGPTLGLFAFFFQILWNCRFIRTKLTEGASSVPHHVCTQAFRNAGSGIHAYFAGAGAPAT